MAFPLTPILQIATELGMDAILVKPKRSIADFGGYVLFEELHNDELVIVDHPVEQGAAITDHAFKQPAEVQIIAGWSNTPGDSSLLGSLMSAVTGTLGGISALLSGNSPSQVKEIYANFLELQEERIPFTVYTGKRVYTNMLVKSLVARTDKDTENSLILKVVCRQIIIVPTAVESNMGDAEDQDDPEDTDDTDDDGYETLDDPEEYNADAGDESLEATADADEAGGFDA